MDKNIIIAIAYDEIADFCLRELQKGDSILIRGKLREKYVEINEVDRVKYELSENNMFS